MEQAVSAGRLRLLMETEVEVDNDAMIVCAGGALPTPFLESLGVEVQTQHGTV